MPGLRFLFVSILLVFGISTPANADDTADCNRNALTVRMPACTRLIENPAISNKDKARALAARGSGYVNRGQRDKAIADFTEALRLDPEPPQSHGYRGRLHNAKRETDLAIAAFTAAIKLLPKDANLINLRGISYVNKRDLNLALADFDAAIRYAPSYSAAYVNRANLYRDLGDLDRAIADFDVAIRLDPKYTSALHGRGTTYFRKGDKDRAMADYDATLAIEPDYAFAFFNRALLHSQNSDQDKAISDYTAAVRVNPDYASAYNNRAIIHANRGERVKAMSDYDQAIRSDPNFAMAYNNRGHAYAAAGDNERAIADYKKVLELPAPAAADKQRQDVARERIGRLQNASRSAGKSAATKPKRVALVIGNSNYANAGVLTNPANDAKAVANAFRRLDFGLVMEVYDVSREQMSKALKDFGDRAEGAEWAVVFFAGHGLELNGTTYLIPVDAALKRDNHIDDETLSLNRVQAKVDAASKLGLVILNSCRNNPFLSRMTRAAGATRSLASGLAPVEPEGNVLVAYAAKHGTVAADGQGANSPFTEALLSHIEKPGLEINFLFRQVRDDVRKKTERRQEPFLYGSLGSEPLFFKTAAR